ncbi:hypothetical protein C3941_14710 [Kaistia algarum]|uniref:hypothetical protein n=1 Tax=Kaistia algarum TaxID=2083279 RepID=UPI000CE7EDE1|nr:hypothetical protein [Kaistia algarum]MCX5514324.1 hypothetical protein [Kaistia algarum]PPE79075.1 hypothetical protein C3941_14710 [Kaistia algarum]
MPLQLFLNDLSSSTEATPRAQAIAYLKGLVATIRAARRIDSRLVLNCALPLNELLLGPETTVASVRNDGICVEESQYLKALNNRAPLDYALAEGGGPDPSEFEYRICANDTVPGGAVANSLGLAHLLKGLGISLATNDLWRSPSVQLDLLILAADGEISQKVVWARNAAEPHSVLIHEPELREELRPPFNSGLEMWAQRAELFPNLEFIPRTKAQIESILTGNPFLEQVWIKLAGIDRAIAAWDATKAPHPMFPFNVRPESKTRLALVHFRDQNGVERTFSDHADLAPIEGRVHFIVSTEPRRHALIGHVGRKMGIG